ncbi:MAG: deoxyguanosinetriphosphate triphosphohydrolase [Desulfobulbus propionicus]|nr:MAG: deoxyguanosinetriphosphate triphosphohydrolase [Desulfobulbus propionicus]
MTNRRTLSIREQQEEREPLVLSSYACLSVQTRGRRKREKSVCALRTCFQRDRDRIIHSKTFRRLKHKTQVFLAPAGDHYRTRLTHVLEVAQIARTVSVCLRLNEYLTEAIALGHDLGHTPFGHAGEYSLNKLHPGGFQHYRQSLRIVDFLERDGRGLNLTWEVRNGILKHSKGNREILPANQSLLPATMEGQVVRVADIIAYVNHDMDDALRAGMLKETDLPPHLRRVLGDRPSRRVGAMVDDLVRTTLARDEGTLRLSARMNEIITELRTFLYDNVYRAWRVHREFEKAQRIISDLYAYFLEHELPSRSNGWQTPLSIPVSSDEKRRRRRQVCDFIAGMTDRYALDLYSQIFMPKPWSVL